MEVIINKESTYNNIIDQLRTLDQRTTILNISRLKFNRFSIEQIVNIINTIPEQIKILDLGSYGSNFRLHKERSKPELTHIYSAIGQKRLEQLITRGIYINDNTTINELVELIKLWPKTLKIFDLGDNEFYQRAPEDFEAIFTVSPPEATILDLSLNKFERVSADKVSKIMTSIPSHFNTLIYSFWVKSNFDSASFSSNYPPIELKKVLTAIPKSITTLDLTYSDIHHLPTDYLSQLEGSLSSVTTFCLNADAINKMSEEQLDALTKMVPNAEKIVIKTSFDGEITTSPNIQYFEDKIEKQAQNVARKITWALSELESSTPKTSGHSARRALPEDITEYTAGFFPRAEKIRKGIQDIRSKNVAKSEQDASLPPKPSK